MSDQTKLRLLWFGGFFGTAVVLVMGLWFVSSQHKKSPTYTTKIVSSDTGEVIYSQPNKAPDTAGQSYTPIFGSQILFDNGATTAQFQLIQQALSQYSQKNLGDQYQTLTILPSSFKAKLGVFTGQLRLGESTNLVDFTITVSQLKYAKVVIVDSSGANGGNYNSGQLVSK